MPGDQAQDGERAGRGFLFWLAIALGVVVLVVFLLHVPLLVRYRRERAAIAEITKLGGDALPADAPPPWYAGVLGESYEKLYSRIGSVRLDGRDPRARRPIVDADLAHLRAFRDMDSLWLEHAHVTDAGLEHLKELGNLEVLIFQDTPVTDASLASLKGLTKLRALRLSGTGIDGPGLGHLAGMGDLYYLRLSPATDSGLACVARLASLRILDLSGSGVTDAGLAHLRGPMGLQVVDLSGTRVTAAGVAALRKALPAVRIRMDASPGESGEPGER